jgi:ABC-type sugar transport system substrate-binding protein
LAVACAITVALLGTACGSSENQSSAGSSSSGASSSSGGNAVVEEAKSNVQALENPEDFTVEPLSGPVPSGKRVAQVNCAIPQCTPGAMDVPVEALGWTIERFDYDLTKGTQDYLRAVDAAIASKPDYIAINFLGNPDLVARQLEQAKAEGITIIGNGTTPTPSIPLMIQSPVVFKSAGHRMADVALADAGAPVKAAFAIDPTLVVFTDIAGGVEERLTEAGGSMDQIQLSLAQPQATNISAIVNYLKAHPDTEYLMFAGTALATGLEQGLRAAGLADQIKLIMSFPFPSDLEQIKSGFWTGVVGAEMTNQWRVVDGMARLAAGDPIENPTPDDEFRLITPENATVEAFDPPGYMDAFRKAWGV